MFRIGAALWAARTNDPRYRIEQLTEDENRSLRFIVDELQPETAAGLDWAQVGIWMAATASGHLTRDEINETLQQHGSQGLADALARRSTAAWN